MAKGWGSGDVLARNIVKFEHLSTLGLSNFNFEGSRAWLHGLCESLRLPALAHLRVDRVLIEDIDVAALITNHKSTLQNVALDSLSVFGGSNEFVEDLIAEGVLDFGNCFRTPWTAVFEALVKINSNECTIHIERPLDCGDEIDILGVQDVDDYDGEHPCESLWGLTVHMVEDDPQNEFSDTHLEIFTTDNKEWRKGIRRLQQMYEYQVYDPERDGTPPWIGDCSDVADFEVQEIRKRPRRIELVPTSESGEELDRADGTEEDADLAADIETEAIEPLSLSADVVENQDIEGEEEIVKQEEVFKQEKLDKESQVSERPEEKQVHEEKQANPQTSKTKGKKRKASQLDESVIESNEEENTGPRRSRRIKSLH